MEPIPLSHLVHQSRNGPLGEQVHAYGLLKDHAAQTLPRLEAAVAVVLEQWKSDYPIIDQADLQELEEALQAAQTVDLKP